MDTPPLLLTHFLHAGPRLPLNKVGFVFDGGRLTADQLDRIRLDPAEHDMWAVHDLATWQDLMAPPAFARLDASSGPAAAKAPPTSSPTPDPVRPPEGTVPRNDDGTDLSQRPDGGRP